MTSNPPHSEATGVAVMTSVEKAVGELRERTAFRFAGDCKCGKCQLVPRALVDKAAALIEQQAAELAEARAEVERLKAERNERIYDPTTQPFDEPFRHVDEKWEHMARYYSARATTAEAERDELLREKERLGADVPTLSPGWAEKARELYDRCKCWPEKTPDGIMALIELRNHVYAALSITSALENGPAGLADAHSKSPDASQSERIAVLEAALATISYHYDNQDLSHLDFRVKAAECARAALAPIGEA